MDNDASNNSKNKRNGLFNVRSSYQLCCEERAYKVKIEMLVIKQEYQNQGYMRRLLQIAFDKAAESCVPCIVSTDGILKMKKYEHLGFEHYQNRKFRDNVYEHDLIKYYE